MIDSKIPYIEGKAIPKPEAGQDTDRIIPARFLKTLSFRNLGQQVYFDERFKDGALVPDHPFNGKYTGATILLAGADYGCGSSREHAPQALKRFGIRAIVAPSYHAIFRENAKNIGLPTVTVSQQDLDYLVQAVSKAPNLVLTVDLRDKQVLTGNLNFPLDIPEEMRQAFIKGTWNSLPALLANKGLVDLVLEFNQRR